MKKKSKKNKAVQKGMFFLEVPIYDREVAVFVGLSHKEIVKKAKQRKCSKSFIESLYW